MKFENVIFDWSGVIKDCFDAHVWGVGEMMKIFGGSAISKEELKEEWKQPYMNFWNKYFPNLTLQEEQRVYHEVLLQKDCPKSYSYPGIVDVIKRLKAQGVFLAIVSSDSPKTLLPEIEEYHLENIFDEIITNVPDKADGVNKILTENDLNKEETIFIGDSNHEIEVGKLFGIKTLGVTWGFCPEERLKALNPDYLARNINELENILLS
jgi:phosphoglycolate phosphatase